MKIWKKYEDKFENIYEETDKIKKKKKRKKDKTKILINVSKQHILLITRIVQEACVEYKKIFYESDYAWYKVLSTKKDNIMKKYKN